MEPWYGAILQDLASFCTPNSGSSAEPKQNNQNSAENYTFHTFWPNSCEKSETMSDSSSSSDSEASSSGSEEFPKVTTKSERIIRRYQIKKSLIQERIFAIDQVRIGALSENGTASAVPF